MRLKPNRSVVAGIFLGLWLLPLGIEWTHTTPTIFGKFAACTSDNCPTGLTLMYSRSIALILAPILFLLITPPKPTQAQKQYILPDRRAVAGLIDLAITITVIGNPVWIVLAGLNQMHFGISPEISLLAIPTGILGGITTLPAWLIYTYWHLATRTQTLGQYVAGYRLVHALPLMSHREPAIQVIFVFLSIYQSRNLFSFLPIGKFDPPSWQERAGVHTETLNYH